MKEDLEIWSKKVKPGGLIAGDDYINWPDVSKAVKEFTEAHSITFNVQGNKWWFINPPINLINYTYCTKLLISPLITT